MNKPVNCGCGGEAEIVFDGNGEMSGVAVKCKKCGITTAYYLDDTQKAIQAWNRAMGAGKDEIAITKGYWMPTYDGLHCSVCNYKCETTALPEVCPHCGTRLIRW